MKTLSVGSQAITSLNATAIECLLIAYVLCMKSFFHHKDLIMRRDCRGGMTMMDLFRFLKLLLERLRFARKRYFHMSVRTFDGSLVGKGVVCMQISQMD
ncbi:hypothetical protein TNIN_109131 [Trichonephila inaurata madagascariensis]|uniref:Uncharacterized protein n=1 Tax=Trichonephila inaurata madagascariensis TaxID=2747483 RepID=A0A8X6MHL2_9ARAC|nr:hypothetical protein TNIN_109131 [Trichonephila inaurata madagascariensis]